MLQVKAEFDIRGLKAKTERETRRLAFSTARALNETIKRVQLEERANLETEFTIRQPRFMERRIKIFTFASPKRGFPFAEIGIDPKPRLILGLFEKGGKRRPFKGKRRVAVPITGGPARPTFAQTVPAELRLGKLRFRRHRTRTGKFQFKGPKRTFILRGGDTRTPGVYIRGGALKTRGRKRFVGRGGRLLESTTNVRLLYKFEEPPTLKPRLGFVELARQVIREEWPRQFNAAFRRRG